MSAAPPPRFTSEAAEVLRDAIAEAGGVEVFAIGRLDPRGDLAEIEIHCRGLEDRVPALLTRPRAGEVVLHNHPSGVIEPSQADLGLASQYGEDGIGVVIVDNPVTRANWVVEPYRQTLESVDPAEVEAFFRERLPSCIEGYEARDGQLDMALEVNRNLTESGISVLEAGTGTGKSLAYLLPAVLWATRNDAKVVVATYTIPLQGQLMSSDLPVLRRAGLDFRAALIKGRANYVCLRKAGETRDELTSTRAQTTLPSLESAGTSSETPARDAALAALLEWTERTRHGTRAELPFPVEEETWDQVASDHDQTLRVRCPHYADCFYYRARREAAAAHVLVVNHHLLLLDLLVKGATGGDGILPRFDRLVVDEAHHLEDAATSLFKETVSARSVARAISPLMPGKRHKGALERIATHYLGHSSRPAGLADGTAARLRHGSPPAPRRPGPGPPGHRGTLPSPHSGPGPFRSVASSLDPAAGHGPSTRRHGHGPGPPARCPRHPARKGRDRTPSTPVRAEPSETPALPAGGPARCGERDQREPRAVARDHPPPPGSRAFGQDLPGPPRGGTAAA
ncbi:MAG: hypothetical protein QGG40_05165 [Myxococcota bacterium]|nr:hypothetical protein [Myxococcota bacterium]